MTVAANPPPLLPCGPIDQAWIDIINDWRTEVHGCLLDLETAQTGLISDLPDIICNFWSPRFFSGQNSHSDGQTGTVDVTIPSGGTWIVFRSIVVAAADGGNISQSQTNINYIFLNDPDNTCVGSTSSILAGGSTVGYTIPNNDTLGQISVFAVRIDC